MATSRAINAKPPAQRKTGLRARIYYVIFGAISIFYVWAYSIPNLSSVFRRGTDLLHPILIILAAFFGLIYLLCSSKYSFFKRPFSRLPIGIFPFILLALPFWTTLNEVLPPDGFIHYVSLLLCLWILFLFSMLAIHSEGAAILLISFILFTVTDSKTFQLLLTTLVVPVLIVLVPVFLLAVKEYVKEHPQYRKLFVLGHGGSARWGSLYSYIKYDFDKFMSGKEPKDAPIYGGKTFWYNDIKLGGRHIGLDSDSMMLTCAAMGGGKSLYSCWNTLMTWRGGAFVLDPKGEHTQRTLKARRAMASFHILDPWKIFPEERIYDRSCTMVPLTRRETFNPLEEIDLESPNARDDIFQIVDACILQDSNESANSKHFRENAQKIMTGVIAHVLSTFSSEYHNLPSVYDTILTGDPNGGASDPEAFKDLVNAMAINEAMGRAPMDAAKVLLEAGTNEKGGFITTVTTGLSWVNTPALRPILMKSSFKMRNMKQYHETVYLIVPLEHMKLHSRFLRTVIALGLLSCREATTKTERILFVLDEFPQLGTFKPVKEGLVTLRDRGVKLWMCIQNIAQLKERYNNWNDFMSSCDKQFFAVNDHETTDEIGKLLGEYVERYVEGKEGETRSTAQTWSLRSHSEILEELKKSSEIQYLFPSDGQPLQLKLIPFYKNFKASEYDTVKGNPHG